MRALAHVLVLFGNTTRYMQSRALSVKFQAGDADSQVYVNSSGRGAARTSFCRDAADGRSAEEVIWADEIVRMPLSPS